MTSEVRPSRVFTVRPALPPRLERLRDLAYNVWWTWTPAAQELFRRIDAQIWHASQGNPVAVLTQAAPGQLQALAEDPVFVADLDRVADDYDQYLTRPTWFEQTHGHLDGLRVAYVSMEFGVAESVPLYSGGLGVLAGDQLKAASDLGVPLVGVGMLYRQGYFRQSIDSAGAQREQFPDNDVQVLPVIAVRSADGGPATIRVPIDGHEIAVRLWRMDVGRVPLILLDANTPENSPADRELTSRLYIGDSDIRIRQELLLGVGGMRALAELDLTPTVAHLNEGHSAFLILERFQSLRQKTGLSEAAAMQIVRATNVFTTHTPVAAGHDEFSADQVRRHAGAYLQASSIDVAHALTLGRVDGANDDEPFGITVLAMRGAAWRNGVSALHGTVSRQMWQRLWPGVPVSEVPIGHVTNGVHLRTWVSRELNSLLQRYMGRHWAERTDPRGIHEGLAAIPDDELWRVHTQRRERLVANVRRRLRAQAEHRGAAAHELAQASAALHSDVLTVGFARRFALYKRPTLLLHDVDRLKAIVSDSHRPVQIIFAGKAHPNDELAKELLREITAISRDPAFEGRLVFVEDYDMGLARDLVQGCDVWLNLPVPPQEASGTSGMKAAANGVLNASVLDGWWDEAYTTEAGWAIGRPDVDGERQRDASDAGAIYDLLEHTVAPLFYDVGAGEIPTAWVRKARHSMALALTGYSANRMVQDYVKSFYGPAHLLGQRLSAHHGGAATDLAHWLDHVMAQWPHVHITDVHADGPGQVDAGMVVPVRTRVALAGLSPDDVTVEVFVGNVDHEGTLISGRAEVAEHAGAEADGVHWFAGRAVLSQSGRVGIAVRVVPRHALLAGPFDAGLIRWSEAAEAA